MNFTMPPNPIPSEVKIARFLCEGKFGRFYSDVNVPVNIPTSQWDSEIERRKDELVALGNTIISIERW